MRNNHSLCIIAVLLSLASLWATQFKQLNSYYFLPIFFSIFSIALISLQEKSRLRHFEMISAVTILVIAIFVGKQNYFLMQVFLTRNFRINDPSFSVSE